MGVSCRLSTRPAEWKSTHDAVGLATQSKSSLIPQQAAATTVHSLCIVISQLLAGGGKIVECVSIFRRQRTFCFIAICFVRIENYDCHYRSCSDRRNDASASLSGYITSNVYRFFVYASCWLLIEHNIRSCCWRERSHQRQGMKMNDGFANNNSQRIKYWNWLLVIWALDMHNTTASLSVLWVIGWRINSVPSQMIDTRCENGASPKCQRVDHWPLLDVCWELSY